MKRFHREVTADHHQFLVYNGVCPDAATDSSTDGLTIPYSGGVVVLTGRSYGPVDLCLDLLDNQPPMPSATWSEIAELSVEVTTGPLAVGTLDYGPTADMPRLDFAGPGWYRLRIAASGRDESNVRGQHGDPVERFVVQVWPAPAAPAVSLRQSDHVGRRFRNDVSPEQRADELNQAASQAYRDAAGVLLTASAADSLIAKVAAGTDVVRADGNVTASSAQVAAIVARPVFLSIWFGGTGHADLDGNWCASWWTGTRSSLSVRGGRPRPAEGPTSTARWTWTWTDLTTPTPTEPFPRVRPLLAAPTEVTLEIADRPGTSRLTVRHAGLPEPLQAPMRVLWRYYLARLDEYFTSDEFSAPPWTWPRSDP